jgi:hypothetical protein
MEKMTLARAELVVVELNVIVGFEGEDDDERVEDDSSDVPLSSISA